MTIFHDEYRVGQNNYFIEALQNAEKEEAAEPDMNPVGSGSTSGPSYTTELKRMAHIAIKRGEYTTAEYLAKALAVHTYGGV